MSPLDEPAGAPRGALEGRLDHLDERRRELYRRWVSGRLQVATASAIPRRSAAPPRPSPEQEGFLEEALACDGLNGAAPIRSQWLSLFLEGDLDRDALRRALADIVARHEPLRTCFPFEDGAFRMRVAEGGELRLVEHDLRRLGVDAQVAAETELDLLRRTPVDLGHPSLVRFDLFRIRDDLHLFAALIDHLVFDGWSFGVFVREVSELYNARREGRSARLAPLAITYRDYAEWSHAQRARADVTADLPFWRARLAELARLRLPSDRLRTSPQAFSLGRTDFALSLGETAGVQDLARATNTTQASILLAALMAVLWRETGERDVCVVCALASRDQPELRDLIGLISSCMFVRAALDPGASFSQWLQTVHQASIEAVIHSRTPADLIEVEWPRVFFGYENYPQPAFDLQGLRARIADIHFASGQADLVVTLCPEPTISGPVCYNANLFSADRVGGWLGALQEVLRGAAARPSSTLLDLTTPLASPSPRPSGHAPA